MTFLPKDTTIPSGSNGYVKFEEGETRLRILSAARVGWEGWKDNKPFRREGNEKNIDDDEVDIDERFTKKPKVRPFWGMIVYDYGDAQVKFLTLTQKKIMKTLMDLAESKDWGDPMGYDLVITKEDTKPVSYTVKPIPPKKISAEVRDAFDASELDLDNLFESDNDSKDTRDFNSVGKKKSKGF